MQFLTDTRIDFLRYRRLWLVVSAVAMVLGLIVVLRPGSINFGIDLSGGSQLIVRFDSEPPLPLIRGSLGQAGLAAQIQTFGVAEKNEVLIKVPLAANEQLDFARVRTALSQAEGMPSFAVIGQEYVGPQIGAELRTKGILAVVLSTLGILAYVWLRFDLRFALGTVVASVHDVLVCLWLYALIGYEFNLTTIAAFLTLVGYSVNDSVVVFDRVRENLRLTRRQPLYELLNKSLNQTLSRTLVTSGTTLLAAGSLLVLGGPVLRGFAFVLTTGVIVGTYSTVFIASPVVLAWEAWRGGRRPTRSRPGSEIAEPPLRADPAVDPR